MELKRDISLDLENIIGEEIPVLDHGFLKVVDYMGTDQSIVDAARVSYGKGTKSVSNDAGLINYLMRHSHSTPLEMCVIKFHIKAPIFVARQWIRHRASSTNEYSGRYSVMDSEFYIPHQDQMTKQSQVNKQGRGEILEEVAIDDLIHKMTEICAHSHGNYKEFLETHDLSRELARIILPLNTYTQWYWKIDLHNLFHFLKLRCDPHAQYEIRVYAEEILKIVQLWVPLAFEAFMNYKMDSFTLSRDMIKIIRDSIDQNKLNCSALNKREREEVMNVFGPQICSGKPRN